MIGVKNSNILLWNLLKTLLKMQRKNVIKRLLIKTLVFNSFYYKMANEKYCNFSSLCEVGIIILLTTSHQIWWKQVYSKLLTTFVEGLAASSDQENIVSKFRLKFNPTKMVKYTQRILRLSLKGLSRSIRFYSPPSYPPSLSPCATITKRYRYRLSFLRYSPKRSCDQTNHKLRYFATLVLGKAYKNLKNPPGKGPLDITIKNFTEVSIIVNQMLCVARSGTICTI